MQDPWDPDRAADDDREPQEFDIRTIGADGDSGARARLSRAMAAAAFAAVMATSLVPMATRNTVPVPLLGWLATTLGPFLLATAFHLARERYRRNRAALAPSGTTRVRVIRGQDRTGTADDTDDDTDDDTGLIPGARPVAPSALVAEQGERGGPGWPAASRRFARLRTEYAAFECDPVRVLRLPALTDVSVPSTARFVDAFADAQSLATERYPGVEHARQFVAAADRAARAWTAAREAAERIRLSGLTAAERGAVDRVLKLLTTARDSDSEPERLVAYARARAELATLDRAGVVHVPRVAQAALAEAGRGQLPA